MKPFAAANRGSFVKNIRKFSDALQHLQKNLDALRQDQGLPPATQNHLRKMAGPLRDVHHMLPSLLAAHTISLFEEEYLRFCDLAICGNEMSEYIETLKHSRASTRRHAKYWHQLMKEFKPFLQEIAEFYASPK